MLMWCCSSTKKIDLKLGIGAGERYSFNIIQVAKMIISGEIRRVVRLKTITINKMSTKSYHVLSNKLRAASRFVQLIDFQPFPWMGTNSLPSRAYKLDFHWRIIQTWHKIIKPLKGSIQRERERGPSSEMEWGWSWSWSWYFNHLKKWGSNKALWTESLSSHVVYLAPSKCLQFITGFLVSEWLFVIELPFSAK